MQYCSSYFPIVNAILFLLFPYSECNIVPLISLVYADGSICLDILQNRWSPTYDVSSILTSIQVLYRVCGGCIIQGEWSVLYRVSGCIIQGVWRVYYTGCVEGVLYRVCGGCIIQGEWRVYYTG